MLLIRKIRLFKTHSLKLIGMLLLISILLSYIDANKFGYVYFGDRDFASAASDVPPVNQLYLPLIFGVQETFYVAIDGDDNNPGSISFPWRTPQYAIENASKESIVYLRAGVFQGFEIDRSDLQISSYPGEMAVIVGDGQKINTIKVKDVSGIEISNLTVQENYLNYGTGIKVENSTDVMIKGNRLQNNQGFGLVLKDVEDVLVDNNIATHNGNAIEVRYGSAGVIIRNNQIYQNDRVVDSGRAGIGITFYRTTGPVTAEGNLIWENHTTGSADPAGVAFEVYAASNITMTGNILWENKTILETGTDQSKTPCDNITFTRNVAFRNNWQQGLILRCASNSLIAHNTFDGLDNFAFNISHNHGTYGASVSGLRIQNNIIVNGRVYSIDTPLPETVIIDSNLVYNPGSSALYGAYLAYVNGFGNTKSLAEFQTWTGYETNAINEDPKFTDPQSHQYFLRPDSPAIDRGISIGEPYYGAAPDLGAFEYTP